ncbi:zona pellucida sperm-binding protein 4-like [Garra rufa]|uniref:zona pellucida sperm-binding protein 4-like n=1 Tax=Garra rufa TaxID=137080 RepID=UPI003CCECD52
MGFSAQNPQALMFQQSDHRFKQSAQQQSAQQVPQKFQLQQPVKAEPVDKCAVADYEQIQCGQPGISGAECEAINCCFNGQQCYYGKAVTVQCIRDGQFVVVVARDVTLPRLSLDSVRLVGGSEPPCAPVDSTPFFAIYQFPVTACGTSMMEDSGYVVYENRMTSSYEVGVGPFGSITRDSHFELLFQCRYSGTAVEALVVEVNSVPAPPPVAAPGPLRVELRLANGQCVTKGCAEGDEAYTSYYGAADYPVTKVLREPVYVEVRILERTDPNLVLMLGRCWATSTPSPLSLPQWDLLIDGCPYYDDRYLTALVPVTRASGLQFPTHYKRFVVKMFTFVDPASLAPLQETIFIHCSTAVCHPSSGSCEQSCGRKTSPAKQPVRIQYDREFLLQWHRPYNIRHPVDLRSSHGNGVRDNGLYVRRDHNPQKIRKRGKKGGVRVKLRRSRLNRTPLPSIVMANVQSLRNKIDDLQAMKVPTLWKQATVVPVPKTAKASSLCFLLVPDIDCQR